MKKLKHIAIFESFIKEGFYDDLNGYVMLGNKEKQMDSGFTVGDRVEIGHKNLKGETIQKVPGEVISIYSKDGEWAIVVKKESGSQIFGTDTGKFADIKDLNKL